MQHSDYCAPAIGLCCSRECYEEYQQAVARSDHEYRQAVEESAGEPIDWSQYEDMDLDDPLLLDLMSMPVRNRNEAGAMAHFAPMIAAYLKAKGYRKAGGM